jgi:NADP-dependent 3-hydroxy acid dehydrogenase YdfG
MENLTNKIAVVLGGTGGVGEGIVRELLHADTTVIVPSRSESNLNDLQEYVSDIKTGTLVPFVGSVNTEENALILSNYLHQNYKSIDMVVTA